MMSRPARFDHEQILSATAEVAAERGPTAASIARIARALRAPTGSIYHRFASRSVLLGEVWLRAAESFQTAFAERLNDTDPIAAGLDAVRYVPQRVRKQPDEARILLLHRRQDFLERDWPAPMAKRAANLQQELSTGLRDFCRRLVGRADKKTLRIVTFALAEAPLAAVRHHVDIRESPPRIVDALIEETYWASLALVGVSR